MSTYQVDRLEIEGFGAVGPRQVIVFPSEPGVYRIDGMNHVEPRLGSNGSGKTTILNALSWVRTGKTLEGAFGPKIISWLRTKSVRMVTEVVEYGTKNGVPYTVKRSQEPNKVSLRINEGESSVVDQLTLDKFFERDHKLFLASTFFAANNKSFMSLGETEQSNRLSEVLNLDVWTDRAAKANKKAQECRTLGDKHESTIRELEARQEARRQTIAEQKELLRTHDEEQTEAKAEDEQRLETLRASVPPSPGKRPTLSLETPAKDAADEAVKASTAAKAQAFVCRRAHKQAESALTAACNELEAFQQTPRKTCHACGTTVTKDNEQYAQFAASFVSAVEEAKNSKNEAVKALTLAETKVEQAERALLVAQEAADVESQEQEALREEHEKRLASWASASSRRDSVLRQIGELEEKSYPNFNTKTLDRCRAELKAAKAEIAELQERVVEARVEAHKHAFAAEAFAKIRMFEMERACAEFTSYMLSAFEILGLVGWDAQVSTTQELKNKQQRSKFNIRMKPAASADWVDWECFSSSQQHRLAQAGDVAFADLVSARCGVHSLDEFWDERTNSLSKQGCEDQMEFLHMRAMSRGRRIFAIDHRTGDSPVFKGLLWVDRQKTGSKIVWKTSGLN